MAKRIKVPPITKADLIYGHKGMQTYRIPMGIAQIVHKADGQEKYDINYKGLHNAADKMRLMADTGFVPKVLLETDRVLIQQDVGDCDVVGDGWSPDDWQDLRRHLVRFLIAMRSKGIRHGDLNGNNILIRNKKPWIIDWQESHYFGEKPPQQMPMPDTHWICQDMIRWIGNPVKSDPYRVCRRWAHIYGDLIIGRGHPCWSLPLKDMTLLDVGCFQGDFSAFAHAEGMVVAGIDPGGFRSGENSIDIGKSLWPLNGNFRLYECDVPSWWNFGFDVILFMDTFPYIVRDYGKEKAIDLLRQMVSQAGRVYFETQQWGDQSGLEWLKTDEDVQGLVPGATWSKIATIPENGVPRTIWRIE